MRIRWELRRWGFPPLRHHCFGLEVEEGKIRPKSRRKDSFESYGNETVLFKKCLGETQRKCYNFHHKCNAPVYNRMYSFHILKVNAFIDTAWNDYCHLSSTSFSNKISCLTKIHKCFISIGQWFILWEIIRQIPVLNDDQNIAIMQVILFIV